MVQGIFCSENETACVYFEEEQEKLLNSFAMLRGPGIGALRGRMSQTAHCALMAFLK